MIRRSHLTASQVFLFIVTTWLAGQSQRGPVRSTFERLASQIVVLGPDEFIYGFRENRQVPPKEFVPVRELTLFLENGNWTKSDFLPLLKHSDAKVRTLALVALYSLDDPQILPDIFPLVTDPASTFVAMLPFAAPSFIERKVTAETTEKQTGRHDRFRHHRYLYEEQRIQLRPTGQRQRAWISRVLEITCRPLDLRGMVERTPSQGQPFHESDPTRPVHADPATARQNRPTSGA